MNSNFYTGIYRYFWPLTTLWNKSTRPKKNGLRKKPTTNRPSFWTNKTLESTRGWNPKKKFTKKNFFSKAVRIIFFGPKKDFGKFRLKNFFFGEEIIAQTPSIQVPVGSSIIDSPKAVRIIFFGVVKGDTTEKDDS